MVMLEAETSHHEDFQKDEPDAARDEKARHFPARSFL
jgi:hypothetical protein